MKDLSIIFPAYNEAERIGPTLKAFSAQLIEDGYDHEIIVVDDGSTDNTVAFVESLRSEIPNLKVIESEENRGKGHAVRLGMLAAKGGTRVFADADGSTPPDQLEALISPVTKGETAISIGSRYADDAQIENKQPWFRRVWSRFCNRLIQRAILPGLVDTQCGFKAFNAKVADHIFALCEINTWSFDLEVLALAKAYNYEIAEVPVRWADDERSNGKLSQLPREIRAFWKIKKQVKLARA